MKTLVLWLLDILGLFVIVLPAVRCVFKRLSCAARLSSLCRKHGLTLHGAHPLWFLGTRFSRRCDCVIETPGQVFAIKLFGVMWSSRVLVFRETGEYFFRRYSNILMFIFDAFDGAFRIAYAVEYRLGSTFARAAEKLATMGDTAAIVTYDPLVGKELLQVERLEHCPPVEVLRPAYAESVRRSCSAATVATGRSLDLLYPYAACRRMRRVYRLSHLVSWLTLLAAAGLALLSVYLDSDMILSSAAVTAWQILLTVLSVVICLTTVKKKALFLSSDPKGGKNSSPKKPPSDPRDPNL